MAEPLENDPLARGSLAGSEDILVALEAPRRASNSRALKIAGLTTLACLLLASQVFTAYMVFDQKQQIHHLQKNSEKMSKQLTRSSQVSSPMKMMSLPMMMGLKLTADDLTTSKTPLTKLQDTAVVSVEKQLTDLFQDSQLPQFNETFRANLESLKLHMNESEWKSFESWMRYWLIFQMAQQKPVSPTSQPASVTQTKCQMEAAPGAGKIGSYQPQCDEQGRYLPRQCWFPTGFCWCVDQTGKVIEGTSMRGRPDCQRVPRRMMAAPMPLQKTFSMDDE